MRPALLAAIALVPALAACQTAPDGAYPSLAIRDVERAQGQLEPVPGDPIDVPPVEVPLDGPLDQRLAALVEQGRSAHARFTEAAPRASRLASARADRTNDTTVKSTSTAPYTARESPATFDACVAAHKHARKSL